MGYFEGELVGLNVAGESEGMLDGSSVGSLVGTRVGCIEGVSEVGKIVG